MKVKESGDIRPVSSSSTSDPSRAAQSREAAGKERVSTEESAKLVAALEVAKQSLGASHSARLASIEAAVRSGAFKPDPQRIASQILDEAEITAMLQAMLKK
jgi:anti-sigma28 factor (negative regulator of flagellin synthesis)